MFSVEILRIVRPLGDRNAGECIGIRPRRGQMDGMNQFGAEDWSGSQKGNQENVKSVTQAEETVR